MYMWVSPDPFGEEEDINLDFGFEWWIGDFECYECWPTADVDWSFTSDGGFWDSGFCFNCWPSGSYTDFHTDSGPGYSMEETTYSFEVSVSYYDYDWDFWNTMFAMQSQAVGPVAPTVDPGQCGRTVWWLDDGADEGGTPTSLTFTSSAGDVTFWVATQGGDKLKPFNPWGTLEVEASGVMSQSPGDIILVAYRQNGNGVHSSECGLDARKPNRLTSTINPEDPPASTGSFCNVPAPAEGFPAWHSYIPYDVVDSLNGPVSGDYGSNEQWQAPFWTKDTNFPNSTWDLEAPEGGRVDSEVMDHLSIGGTLFPGIICEGLGRDFRVVYRDQFIRIGSAEPGVGVLVQCDQVEFRRGHGGHYFIASPCQ